MKRILPFFLAAALLSGCGGNAAQLPAATEGASGQSAAVEYAQPAAAEAGMIPYTSRFDSETVIVLSDDGITVNGGGQTPGVYTSHDIVYYEDRDFYPSGNRYGEGADADKHTADEADAHTVVNITEPGSYRISGKLSAGQIRIDLGENAYYDKDAVVELILDGADITCTVAPAILFENVYECDGDWDADNTSADVDTSAAGAVLVLEGENNVSGSYVAKIFKDNDKEKKLWKQDGAVYSYMSMNVEGAGVLNLTAENEGLDTELHLTINGGNLNIRSGNDGINTNEDGVSVTTINGGSVHIIAGLGEEGDGIDSNGYLVINGGIVVSAANPASDAGLDSDLGSYINGGTVIALGSTMDWAESDSEQVTMNLQFTDDQSGDSALVVTREDGTVIFAYDPGEDEILGDNARRYQGAVISCANFGVGESYYVYTGGTVSGSKIGGIYDVTTVTGFDGGTQMMYTGTDVGRGPFGGGMGGQRPGGEMPEGMEMPAMPDGEMPAMPENFGERGQMPTGEMPEDFTMPEGFEAERPEDFDPGVMEGDFGERFDPQTLFYMGDKVNSFSGLTAAEQ
ncbi:MAG: carbohydrate-binding domain-containing protein [Oscillospiraceae bacterium]|nr:carbohydrate-binding domain-containing protein [Oscillospiraceae bacterium]